MKYIRLFEDFQLGDLNFMSPEEIKGLFFEECRKSTPDLELIRVIVENGLVDVSAKNKWDETPLHRAGSVELAKLLIDSGADVRAKNKWDNTPLHLAVGRDNKELAELLIASGADVNTKGYLDRTPLHVVVWRDNIDLAKLLIASGADVKAKDEDDETPLHRAVRWDNIALAELLIASGADVNTKGWFGGTKPLDLVKSEEMKSLLKQHGAVE